MGNLKVNIGVSSMSPLASDDAHNAMNEWIDASKKEMADYATRQLLAVGMDKTGRATGHYQGLIRTTVLAYGDVLVDDPVVYGPWLEGTSQRNQSTRFKGYRLWRKAKQATSDESANLAQGILPRYAQRIGITDIGIS